MVSTFLDPALTGPGLDIGCGTGQHLPLLATQCEHVVAADLSEGMLAALPGGPWERRVQHAKSLDTLRAYFRSVTEEWAWRYQIDWPILEAVLNRRIDERAGSGPITISTRSGTLVAHQH